jgi:hypothetical protein
MGYMQWAATFSSQGTKILHLRLQEHEPWRPYTAFPQYSVPDYRIPGGSKGWATYVKLRSCGWELVASEGVDSAIDNKPLAE